MYPQGFRRAICLEGIYALPVPGGAHFNHNMQTLHSSGAALCFKRGFDTNSITLQSSPRKYRAAEGLNPTHSPM